MVEEYFILDLNWTRNSNFKVWRRPDNGGYTFDLNQAGKYTADQVEQNPKYNNKKNAVAILVDDVLDGKSGQVQTCVLNSLD